MKAPKPFLLIALVILCACRALAGEAPNKAAQLRIPGTPPGSAEFWLETSLKRIFPGTRPGDTNLQLLVPRNGKASFQVGVRSHRLQALQVKCEVSGDPKIQTTVRAVGMVPLPHLTVYTEPSEREGSEFLPGLVPDVLYPTNYMRVGPEESSSFWISVFVPENATAGEKEMKVSLNLLDTKQTNEIPFQLRVSPFVVLPRTNFPITHWWRGEATWDYYKTGMFDERWWQITRWQMENMLAHGSDVVYVPVFFNRKETFKRPCQLLIVNEPSPGKFEFDWSRVKRFTDMCREIGFSAYEWSHLWIYGGVRNPMRVYKEVNGQHVILWDPGISGFDEIYLNFLRQFLPELHKFLEKEQLLDRSYFHLSDEPLGKEALNNYKKAREFLREHAPWMKVMDAMYSVEFARESGTDMPIPQLGHAKPYREQSLPHWVYFCCSPKGPWLNRFLDTPLPKIRMAGWLFYRLEPKGFLHWGFNYWHKMEREEIGDPFHDASNDGWPGIPYGDGFMIYPGKDGRPLDCIRWEVFAESLQDYAILQSSAIRPDAPVLQDLKGYDDFPKNEAWIKARLKEILDTAAGN